MGVWRRLNCDYLVRSHCRAPVWTSSAIKNPSYIHTTTTSNLKQKQKAVFTVFIEHKTFTCCRRELLKHQCRTSRNETKRWQWDESQLKESVVPNEGLNVLSGSDALEQVRIAVCSSAAVAELPDARPELHGTPVAHPTLQREAGGNGCWLQ